MKRPAVLFGFLTFLFFLTSLPGYAAKQYRIERVEILAEVLADGSVRIEEARSYRFRGRFTWADYRLPKSGFTRISEFQLRDETGDYRPGTDKEPGTFQVRETDDEFYVKWFYRAENESRRFVLSYRVHDVVTVYEDMAELYYQFVGAGWDHPSGEVEVTVRLPGSPPPEQIRAWAHGPLWGTVTILESGEVHFTVQPLPRKQFWEGRILFPPELVPGASKRFQRPHLTEVLEEESRWAEEANSRREEAKERQRILSRRKKKMLPWVVGLSLLAIIVWVRTYSRYGRNFPAREPGKYYSELPSELQPVLVNYLMSYRSVNANGLLATLFDLARRGFVRLEEQKVRRKVFFKEKDVSEYLAFLNREQFERNKDKLEPFEDELLQFFFIELTDGAGELQLSRLAKSRSRVLKWFRKWKEKIGELAERKEFLDPQSLKAMRRMMFFSGVLAVVGGLSIIWLREIGVIPLTLGSFLFFLSLMFPRVRREFAEEMHRWQRLRNYLKRYAGSRAHTEPLMGRIDRYLVYAVALNVPFSSVKKLLANLPSEVIQGYFPWFAYYGQGSGGSFADAFSGMMTVAGGSGGGAG